MKKRIMALFLCICMIMSLMPSAFAETAEEESVSAEASLINTDDAAEVCAETDKEADTEVKTEEAEEQLDYFEETVGIERNTFRPVEIKTESFKYINPIYADVISENDIPDAEISESDLDALKLRVSGTQTLALDDELSDIASAGAEVRRGLVARNSSVSVNYLFSGDITNDQLQQLVFGIFNEALKHTGNPVEGDYILYQLGGYSVEIAYSDEHFLITYEIAYYTSPEQESEMNSAVAAALAEMQLDGMSNYEKLHTIYRYICKNVDYNNAMNDIPLQFTGYAALVKGLAVCQGYSVLLYRLCLSEGIDARIVDSKNMNHSWNIVSMGGKYYALDATWDSNFDDNDTQYMYFMKGSNYWLANHVVGGISELGVQYNDGAFAAYYAIAEEDFSPTNIIASGECGKDGDNLTWTLDENGVLTISGTGEMANFGYASSPWYEHRYDIKTAVIPDSVTNIGSFVFYNCSSLTSIEIPDSVTSIGNAAFFECSNLTSIEIPDSVTSIGNTAFFRCSSLTSVTIPNGVSIIRDETFQGCKSLTSIEIPDSVTSIRYGAFSYCSSLASIEIPNGVTRIGDYAFSYCSSLTSIVIPDSVTSIGDYAFRDCDSLTSIEIPNSVTIIGNSMFYNCSNLTSVTLPDKVTRIEDNAFCGCQLTEVIYNGSMDHWNEVVIGKNNEPLVYVMNGINVADGIGGSCGDILTWNIKNGVLTISGEGAMNNYDYGQDAPWRSLNGYFSNAVIENGVTSIGSYAFNGCDGLMSVTISDSVTSIGDSAFYECSSLTSIEIPDSVTSIGYSAFPYCSSLTSIEIPNSVTIIGSSMFYRCSSLTSIVIPDSVTCIDIGAFSGCSSLTSIAIPDSVTSIGNWAFSGCDSLTDVYYGGTEDEWNEITISDDNKPLTDANIHFTENNIIASGECGKDGDNLTWTLDENGVLTISGEGEMANFDYASSPWYEHRYDIKTAVISEGITSICSYAFSDCSSLTSIEIPDSVTSIGWAAFMNCSALTSINLPNSVTSIGNAAFADCSNLTSIIIPDSVTSIERAAFAACSSLTSIKISDSVTSIGDSAFYWCSSLTSIEIPDSVTCIGDSAFWSCSSLTSVTIPDGVTSIGESAFSGCSSLTSIEIPNSVTIIGNSMFYNCSSLTSIEIPDSVTCIDTGAFSGCSSLTDVYYGGTEDEWNEITISYYNEPLTNANIHFTENNIIASGNCGKNGDNVTWTLDENGNLTISGEGEMADYSYRAWNSYTDSITNVIIKSGVTSICNYAFSNCSSLTSIEIPDSVTSIGDYAFSGCSNLNEIIVSETNKLYSSIDGVLYNKDKTELILCPHGKVGQVIVPDSVTSIGDFAFRGCISLTSIEISDSVTSIGDFAFIGCSSLTSIEIPDGVTSIGFGVFEYCSSLASIEIPDSVTSIGDEAFWNCSSLTSIVIPASVTSIGRDAFYNCSSLTSIAIPDSVTCIDIGAFSGCSNLNEIIASDTNKLYSSIDGVLYNKDKTELIVCPNGKVGQFTVPDSVTSIDSGAFLGCSSLTSIAIPNSVTSVGDSAFSGCSSLTSIEIPDSVTSIGDYAFSGCSSLTSIEIPDSVTSIGDYAFFYCSSLTSIVIPDSVTNIGSGAFEYCSSLTSIEIPDSVTNIGSGAFEYCSSLTSIEIPNSVTSIGSSAFYNCSSLTSIVIPNKVTSIGDYAFSGCSSLTSIIIPDSVTSIVYAAFHGCDSLTDVYYGGTEDEWNEIAIGSYNDDLKNARIHFIGPNFSIVPSITVTDNNTATAEVDSAHVDDLVSAGIEKVHIDVTDTTAENVTVNIPANAVDTIANNNMPVQLDTPAANLTIPAETMQSIQTQTSDELSISVFPTKIPETLPTGIDKNSLACAVSVLVNNGDITTFNGKTLTIDIPVEDGFTENKTYKVLVISADGSSELLNGKCIQGENGKYVQVTTTHLSVFIPMLDEQQDDVLIGDANGDGVINIFDAVRLKKYLAGMDVEISAGSDVTGDGVVNIFDAVRLQKYLAGMDVSLGK